MADPDFVNPEGTKWWRFDDLTNWALRENGPGKPILDIIGWQIETVLGYKAYVLTRDNKFLADNQSIEALATKIDMLRASESNEGTV